MKLSLGKWTAWTAAIIATALAASCIAYTPARTFELRTTNGAPVADAFVAYYYVSSVFNFVDSLSRYYPGRLVVSDTEGRVHIPGRLALKRPLDSQPVIRVNFVFAPELHNALQTGPDADSFKGVFRADAQHRNMILNDLSDHPALWQRSLQSLLSSVRYDLWPRRGGAKAARYVVTTRAEIAPLVAAVEKDYLAFRARHANSPRGLPSEESISWWRKEEREERMARLKEQLEREPLWGPYLERHWGDNVVELKRAFNKLPD